MAPIRLVAACFTSFLNGTGFEVDPQAVLNRATYVDWTASLRDP